MKNLQILTVLLLTMMCCSFSNAQIRDVVNAAKAKHLGSQKVKPTGKITENDKRIEVRGNDHKKTFKMDGQILELSGNGHQITVKGYASKIIIHGTTNSVISESVSSIIITGVENQVQYRSSPNKNGKASTQISGVDNSAVKIK